jgi:hypothetical protein
MSPVGGSRHYQGGGLGVEGGWGCPSCGSDNAGPIAQGCTVCGAGRPGRHIGTEPPTPPAPTPEPSAPPAEGEEQLGPYDRWALAHPRATLEEAFSAGFAAGYQNGYVVGSSSQPRTRGVEPTPPDQSKIARTIVAALEYFTEQVLQFEPDEVTRNDWCSAAEVRNLIEQLTTTGDLAHA